MDARLNTMRFAEAGKKTRVMLSFDTADEYRRWSRTRRRWYREVGQVTNPMSGAIHVWIVKL